MNRQKSFTNNEEGALYIVGTPIGNLEDLSPRALTSLKEVDFIAAEDTRHTRKLLTYFQFSTPLISLHEHNQRTKSEEIIQLLLSGKSIAVVSDAGMPAISDPGEVLVERALEHDIPVIPIPGPNAAITALVASGLPTQPFLFIGFLPRQKRERTTELDRWSTTPATLILYEAPHRLKQMLGDCLEILGDRRIAVARELTKRHEEWLRGTIVEVLTHLEETATRGEYTIMIEGAKAGEIEEKTEWWTELSLIQHVEDYINGGMDKKAAIREVAQDRGIPKREVYNNYIQK